MGKKISRDRGKVLKITGGMMEEYELTKRFTRKFGG